MTESTSICYSPFQWPKQYGQYTQFRWRPCNIMWTVFMETILATKVFIPQTLRICIRFIRSITKYGIFVPHSSAIHNWETIWGEIHWDCICILRQWDKSDLLHLISSIRRKSQEKAIIDGLGINDICMWNVFDSNAVFSRKGTECNQQSRLVQIQCK